MEKQKNKTWKWILAAWILAVIITLAAAYYQRITGPTYPLKVNAVINGIPYTFSLKRSANCSSDCEIRLPVKDREVPAYLIFRRYPTNEAWDTVAFHKTEDGLSAMLPAQPAAGKLEYFLMFKNGAKITMLLQQQPNIIRFKGDVPAFILIPHILFIFLGMMLSNLAGLMAAFRLNKARLYSLITFFLIMVGGMILGPVVQKYAFGELWTGVPFGWDLTDNKTLIAFIAWITALVANRKKFRPGYIIAAAIVTLVIFSIPHSMWGSELNPVTGAITTG